MPQKSRRNFMLTFFQDVRLFRFICLKKGDKFFFLPPNTAFNQMLSINGKLVCVYLLVKRDIFYRPYTAFGFSVHLLKNAIFNVRSRRLIFILNCLKKTIFTFVDLIVRKKFNFYSSITKFYF
jgi:hypothetical protein